MPRPKAKCGTYSAYKRHKRDGEEVDLKCIMARDQRTAEQREARKAGRPAKTKTAPSPKPPAADFDGWEDFDSERRGGVETPDAHKSREDRLRWQLALLETAMAKVAEDEPAKLAPLAKRHSELLDELDNLNDAEREADPFDEFFNGDLSNVVGFPTAQDRKTS